MNLWRANKGLANHGKPERSSIRVGSIHSQHRGFWPSYYVASSSSYSNALTGRAAQVPPGYVQVGNYEAHTDLNHGCRKWQFAVWVRLMNQPGGRMG
jgi:hypothetical protein